MNIIICLTQSLVYNIIIHTYVQRNLNMNESYRRLQEAAFYTILCFTSARKMNLR